MMPTAGRLMGNGCCWLARWEKGTAADRTVESQRRPRLCHRPGRGADAAAHRAARTDHAVQGPRSCVLGPGLVNFVFWFCSQINLVNDALQDPTSQKTLRNFFGVRVRSAYFFGPAETNKVPCSKPIRGFFRMHLAKDTWKLQPPRGYKEWGRGEFAWSD